VYELNTLFQNLVTVSRLSRVPSIKEMARDAHIDEHSLPYGLLGYPVLQAADILLSRADLVPVGRDNVAHVEVAREIARRFNTLYGEVFPEPEVLVSDVPALVGTDGRSKMSKSRGNAIMLSDDEATVRQKVMAMYTDPTRVRADVPGTIEGNPVFMYHDIFNSDRAEVEDLQRRYRAGRVGDVEVKSRLAVALNRYLAPMRERMAIDEGRPGLVETILAEGVERVRAIAEATMSDVHDAMGLDFKPRPKRHTLGDGRPRRSTT
jgi:tryptophanyl-tRNA synthetase